MDGEFSGVGRECLHPVCVPNLLCVSGSVLLCVSSTTEQPGFALDNGIYIVCTFVWMCSTGVIDKVGSSLMECCYWQFCCGDSVELDIVAMEVKNNSRVITSYMSNN